MAYRNKTYVCFDADSDIHYYRLMCAWKQNDNTSFNFHNAHDLNNLLRLSQEDTIKRKLRERLLNSKTFVVLVGERTRYLYKFVRWEIEQALGLDLPIIVVNLNGRRYRDDDRCPPIVRDVLAMHVSFNLAIVQYALENWEPWHYRHRKQDHRGPYYYEARIYQSLGL